MSFFYSTCILVPPSHSLKVPSLHPGRERSEHPVLSVAMLPSLYPGQDAPHPPYSLIAELDVITTGRLGEAS